ncbi:MAG: hypothetical protein AB7T31_16810 [Gemmatimonadales bacterium]
MFTNPVRPRTRAKLAAMAEPSVVSGGQSEALEWELFDTQLYTSATTTELTFFSAAPANPFIGNIAGANGLPTPQYFEVYYFGLDVLRVPGNTDVLGDLFRIIKGAGGAALQGIPTWSFVLADKQMGPFPLAGLQSMGGITGFSTRTAQEYGNVGNLSSTFCSDGAIVIPPTQSFRVVMRWPAALTLSANVQIVAQMRGVLHRRVL